MFSKPTAFIGALVIATAALATAASAGVEYHGGPKAPWSVSSGKSWIDHARQNADDGLQNGMSVREQR
jgi:hypothetical protein